MKFFLRYFLPITYFQATRLNRWALVGYNGLVEWLPAFVLSAIYGGFTAMVFTKVILSYLAFICIYEIGYITNDFLSERFENDPRGRLETIASQASKREISCIVAFRALCIFLISYFFVGVSDTKWLVFHSCLALTFALHNSLPSESRIASFFGLSTFRFFAPIILTVPNDILMILFPAVLLNNSLYRVTVYLRNKNNLIARGPESVKSKFAFYFGALPLSVFLAIMYGSPLPIFVCLYFLMIWFGFFVVSRGDAPYRKQTVDLESK